MIGGFTESSFADISAIQFQNTPLFGEANFIPGNSVSRWVKITNNTNNTHRTIVRALDINNSDHFGNVVTLQIKQNDIILYNNTFSDFFSKPEIILPQVGAGETNTIYFIATFVPESGNEYQNKTMNFSLQVGLEDVESSIDTTTTIGGGSNGSYITLGLKTLLITNENATAVNGELGSMTVSWTTNIPATSQVIYGLTSGGPYNLDMSAPNFGYPFSTTEEDLNVNKTTNHNVNILGLPLGTYSYRVVSRASPATIGYEYHFVAVDERNLLALNNKGQVLGASREESIPETTKQDSDQNSEDLNNTGGNILGASAGNILGISNVSFWILIVVLLFLVFLVIKNYLSKNKK